MKKFILGLLGAAVVLTASAQKYTQDPILNGPYVVISNSTTVLYGATNVVYANPQSFNEYLSFATNYNSGTITNGTLSGGMAIATNFNQYVVGQLVPLAGSLYPLLSLTNHPSTTNAPLFGPAWSDALVFADRNGNAPSSAALHVTLNCDPYQQGLNSTNAVFLEFRKIVGLLKVPGQLASVPMVSSDTSANDLLVLRLLVGGQTNYVFSTNLTSGQLAGAYGWRMTSVQSVTTNLSPVGFFLYDVSLDSWVP